LAKNGASKMEKLEVREVPEDIERRLAAWRTYWKRAVAMRYLVGIVGITDSCIAAANFEDYSQFAAIISALCIGVLGFVQPEQKYLKFIQAWRRLDSSMMKFKFGQIEIGALLQAVEDSESIITEIEKETRKTTTEIPTNPTTDDKHLK